MFAQGFGCVPTSLHHGHSVRKEVRQANIMASVENKFRFLVLEFTTTFEYLYLYF